MSCVMSMRYKTKHKLYGRAQLVVAVRTMLQELDEARKAADALGLNAPAVKPTFRRS